MIIPSRKRPFEASEDAVFPTLPAPPVLAHRTAGFLKLIITPKEHDPSVRAALSNIPRHTEYFRVLSGELGSRTWHHINSIPDEVKALDLSYPVLLPRQRCWKGRSSPLAKDILAACKAQALSKKYIIESGGQRLQDARLGDVLRELVSPPTEKPQVAHNIVMEGLEELNASTIPLSHLRPHPETALHYSMNITPQNTIIDIHIDQGATGLSIGLGSPEDDETLLVHKVWFFWPPSEHNLNLFEDLRQSMPGRGLCLARSQSLEHGIVASAGIHEGVVLPPGWLHATITTNGGFLGGVTYDLPCNFHMVSSIFAMDMRLDVSSFPEKAPLFTNALREFLTYTCDAQQKMDAIDAWFDVEGALKRAKLNARLKRNNGTCMRLLAAWKLGRFELVEEDECVACGWNTNRGGTFGEHFWREHLRIVMAAGCKMRYRKGQSRRNTSR